MSVPSLSGQVGWGARLSAWLARPTLPSASKIGAALRREATELNAPLVIGGLSWLGCYLLAIYGPNWAPHDQFFGLYHIGNATPPFPPGVGPFTLGSDQLGRDVLSWILIGARPTLLLVAVGAALRMALALPLGLLAGWRLGALAERLLSALAAAMSALPAVIAAMLALLAVGIGHGGVALVAGMVAFGWAPPMLVVRQSAAMVATQEYVAAARSLGSSERRLLWRHVLTNVLPAVSPIAILQVAGCLILLTELGFLQLFLGGGIALTALQAQGIGFLGTHMRIPATPEWGGLLAQDQPLGLLYSAPWIVLAPLAFIAGTCLGTAALASGLTRYARDRALGRLLSPPRLLGILVVLSLLALPARLAGPPDPANVAWAKRFDAQQAVRFAQGLTNPAFGDRAAGSAGATAVAIWLAGQFASLGLAPAGEQGYLRSAPLPNLLPEGTPGLTFRRNGQTSQFRSPDVAALAIPWSAGGSASGRPVFMGHAGVLLPGTRPRVMKAPDLSGAVAVLAPPDRTFPIQTLGTSIDSVTADGAAAVIVVDDGPAAPYQSLGTPGGGPPGLLRVPIVKVSGAVARALFAGTAISAQTVTQVADDPGFDPVPLAGTATVVSGFGATPTVGEDVAALVPSTAHDPRLLVVAASYDTDGEAGEGSGAAVLLELAAMVAAHPVRQDVLFLGLAGGPPGDGGMLAALQAPPSAGRPILLLIRLDDVGGGGPLAIGAYSPDYHPEELAARAGRAAAAVGAVAEATPAIPGKDTGGTLTMQQFTSGDAPLDGPALAIAAESGRGRAWDASALAAAGKTATVLLLRASTGQ